MRIFSKCETCGKKRFIVKKRKVQVPYIGHSATSKKFMCRLCFMMVQRALTINSATHAGNK